MILSGMWIARLGRHILDPPGPAILPIRTPSMNPGQPPDEARRDRPAISPGRVLLVTTVMLTFMSYWRTAAVVLCDLASTAYYIGGIVEAQIGKAAPWFILAVMVFSYAVRSIYIESCSMFTRGGVYRVVKEAMGGTPAKLSVSALLFDYVLTGPISGVSAGQYLIGLSNEVLAYFRMKYAIPVGWGSAAIAAAITLYFWRANVRGLRESSDKALRIMAATTVMGVIIIAWCGLTLATRPDARHLPSAAPDLSRKVDTQGQPKINEVTGRQEDPLGWLGNTSIGATLHDPSKVHWLSLVGVLGILIAFGHSVLAMSGEETLAQVYREVESPKLANFKKAAFIVFVYSLMLTSLISFFAVMIIPDDLRVDKYSDNLIGGLAMSVVGPAWARLALHGLVVIVGFLILAGAVNTAIVGSNGVLNRVAEDEVLPEWFLKPHPTHGTTYRLLNLIVGLQLFTILVSHGDVILLGEAYAFGVVWSFVFKAMAMLVLRFRRPGPRAFMVPGNIKIGAIEWPIGIALIFLVLLAAASVNLLSKPVATISGGIFTVTFFAILMGSERYLKGKEEPPSKDGSRLEEFNVETAESFSPEALHLEKSDRALVGVRSNRSLEMLKKYLAEVDPEKTDVVVVASDVVPRRASAPMPGLSRANRELLSQVVKIAEEVGKPVQPLVVPTDDPFHALARIAHAIGAREIIMGASKRMKTKSQLDRIEKAWKAGGDGEPRSLTVRILGKDRDDRRELGAAGRP
jgi:amino acid transporter